MNSTTTKATITVTTTNTKAQPASKIQKVKVYNAWGKARDVVKCGGIQI